MPSRAREGACLAALIRMAIPVCRQAERRCPRQGAGRKPEIPEWVMAVLIAVAVAKRRKTKSAQYRYLSSHRRSLLKLIGADRFPSRSTYFDRYRRAHGLLQSALLVNTQRQIHRNRINVDCVAVDKSLIDARGPLWHSRQRCRGHRPRGVDADSTWTYSAHHGWVQGYGYEVVVTAGKQGPVWPVLASVDPANWRENRTFPEKIRQLPAATRFVLLDAGYDSEDLAADVEQSRRGRRFVCPLQNRHNVGTARKRWRETHVRKARRERRERRREYMQTKNARRLYAHRSTSVEPFNEWFKSLFELNEQAWHRGLANNRTQILAALFVYQLLLRYNRHSGHNNARVKWILDTL